MTTPRRFTRRHQRRAVLVGALLCSSAVALVAPAAPALAADGPHTKGIIPPNNPPANVPPSPSYWLVQASGIVTGFGGAKVFHVQGDSPPKVLS